MTESRKRKAGVWATMLLVQAFTIAGVITLGVVAYQQSERAAQAESAAAVADERRDAESAERGEAIEALREQVLELGEEPVVEPVPESSSPTVINGKDGQDGRDAPPPTAEQMLAAVQQCFEVGLCTAPKGDRGDAGSTGDRGEPGADSTVPGPAGVGISTIECMDDGAWRFTMTDGTVRDTPGPCKAPPLIEPTPEPSEGEPTP